jgi:phage FluMu protein Com
VKPVPFKKGWGTHREITCAGCNGVFTVPRNMVGTTMCPRCKSVNRIIRQEK